MRPGLLLREALTAARSSPVPSGLVLLVVAAMCFAALATVGRQAAVEAAVAQELSGPAARTLTVTDTGGSQALTGPLVHALSSIEGTSAVVARERPVDAVNGALGEGSTPVAVVGLHGTIDAAVEITRGRPPGPEEVIVPEQLLERLRLSEPAGHLQASDGTQWAIVGQFRPHEPFEDLATMAVAAPETTPQTVVQQVRVLAGSLARVEATQDASLALIAGDPTEIQVAAPTALSASNELVTSQLAGLGRSLLLLILGAGSFFVAVVVLADVLIRRRDLGRRRTLGITRSDLIALVTLRTTIPAIVGAVVGTAGGYLLASRQGGSVPLDFTLAVICLASLTAAVACLPPAAYAATRDPVAVMRTP